VLDQGKEEEGGEGQGQGDGDGKGGGTCPSEGCCLVNLDQLPSILFSEEGLH